MTKQAVNPLICIVPSASEFPSEIKNYSTDLQKESIYKLSPRLRHHEYPTKKNEETNILMTVRMLSSIIGSQWKYNQSFSLSNVDQGECMKKSKFLLYRSKSDSSLCNIASLQNTFEISSRSLSTWVAIGDNSVTSELPSPQVCKKIKYIYLKKYKEIRINLQYFFEGL